MTKTAILFNPSSGQGKSLKQKNGIIRVFQRFGLKHDWFETESEIHLIQLARRAVLDYQNIIVIGGDTSFTLAAREIAGAKDKEIRPVLGFLGTGSANDIVRGLGTTSAEKLCQAVINQRIKGMDAGFIQADGLPDSVLFLGSVSLGLGVSVNRYVEELKKHHPLWARFQRLAGIKAIAHSFSKSQVPQHLNLKSHEWLAELTFSLLVFLNSPFYATGLKLVSQANPWDGLLDAFVLSTDSWMSTMKIALNAKGSLVRSRHCQFFHESEFSLLSESSIHLQVDGQIMVCPSPVKMGIFPRAIDVFALD